jgi:hypothetical protein
MLSAEVLREHVRSLWSRMHVLVRLTNLRDTRTCCKQHFRKLRLLKPPRSNAAQLWVVFKVVFS